MIPPKTGKCYCGCGRATDGHWAPGHDSDTESAIVKAYGSRAAMAVAHGFGPDRPEKSPHRDAA